MGFFSWVTQDTKRSIANDYSIRKTFPVTMTDNKGNKWHERYYEGYGVFGGKDYYQLVAEMNNKATGDLNKDRTIGIGLELGIIAIQHKETKEIYKGGGNDFLHWDVDVLANGLTANKCIEMGDWLRIRIFDKTVILPNLTENPNHIWVNKGAEHCSEQGYFYGDE